MTLPSSLGICKSHCFTALPFPCVIDLVFKSDVLISSVPFVIFCFHWHSHHLRSPTLRSTRTWKRASKRCCSTTRRGKCRASSFTAICLPWSSKRRSYTRTGNWCVHMYTYNYSVHAYIVRIYQGASSLQSLANSKIRWTIVLLFPWRTPSFYIVKCLILSTVRACVWSISRVFRRYALQASSLADSSNLLGSDSDSSSSSNGATEEDDEAAEAAEDRYIDVDDLSFRSGSVVMVDLQIHSYCITLNINV